MKNSFLSAIALATLLTAGQAYAQDYTITLKDNVFTPADIAIPAGQKIVLTVKNDGNSPAEFESSELDREKVVGAHSSIAVKLGPLDAGTYHYVNDFHPETKGTITAK